MHSIESALKDLQAGKMIIVTDDENRENEGDLICAAEHATPEMINFMAKEGRGLICVAMEEAHALKLNFHPMVPNPNGNCNFMVSVDAREGITTGISAADRALTIKKIIDPSAQPTDFIRPGHMFPVVCKRGGVSARPGHTEAAVDLMKLSGLKPAGVICEIIKDDGKMARMPDLEQFAKKHDLKMITIQDLIQYRSERGEDLSEISEPVVSKEAEADLSTEYGDFKVHIYRSKLDFKEHVALTMGDLTGVMTPLVRLHSECLTGDILKSKHCDCGEQLNAALELIGKRGNGVLIYMRQEGRGIGLANKIKTYALQAQGRDTVEANAELGFESDLRDYSIGAQILVDLGVKNIELLTNNPKKVEDLEKYGITITKRIPIVMEPNEMNKAYLRTKKKKMGHIFEDL